MPAVAVRLDQRPQGVGRLRDDRERRQAQHASGSQLMIEFVERGRGARRNATDLRAVVLTGAGDKAFIGGAEHLRDGARSMPRAPRASSRWCIAPATACANCPSR